MTNPSKARGTRLERTVAVYLAAALNDDRIERRALNGTKDRGYIAGVRTPTGDRVVIEVKNTARMSIGVWINEVEVEKGNDDARVGVCVHKRYGKAAPGEQLVTMRLEDFARVLGGDL